MNINSIKTTIKGDFTGGLTAAIIALPMALAFGEQSGLGPQAGIYTAIFLAITASLIAGTKTLISDPTAPMTIIAAGVVTISFSGMELSPLQISGYIILSFAFSGIFQVLFGLVKVAQYVKYISYPVLSGFMGGIGIMIILSQWHQAFGLPKPDGPINIITSIPSTLVSGNWHSILLSVSTIAVIYISPLLYKKIPAGLFALIIGTLISIFLLDQITGDTYNFATLGLNIDGKPQEIPNGFSPINFKALSSIFIGGLNWEYLTLCIVSGLTLAGLGTIDTLLTSVVADNITKTKHNGNRELIGQGLGNLISALFNGIPGAGSTTGTVANIKSNGKTNLSGIIKGLILLLILLGLGKYLGIIPKPVLSGLLITVGIGIIDFKGIMRLIKLKNSDSLVLILVIILTVFADLLVAVGVGMVLSSFFFMQRMGELVDQQSKQGNLADIEKKLKIPEKIKNRIYSYELDGPLFYGFSDQFKEQAEAIKDKEAVIINMSNVPYIDASGIYVLEEVITSFKDKKMDVILVGVKDHIFKQFEDLKVIPQTLPEEKAYNSIRSGLKYLKNQLEHEL
jgi:sulfate permease, SulP family